MNIDVFIRYKRPYVLLFALICFVSLYGKDDLKTQYDFLDHIMKNKELFVAKKVQEINSLKRLLDKEDTPLEYRYEINDRLYGEYKKFKLDSAIFYARENLLIGEILQNFQLKYQAEINLANTYSYSGKFLESESILKNIDRKKMPEALLPAYYEIPMS